MSKTATPRKIVKLLIAREFVFSRQRGSHAVYIHRADKTIVVVPMHARELSKGTLSRILKLSGLTVDDL